MATNLDTLTELGRTQFANCYTLTIERNREQLFMGDIDDATLEQALSVFERNKQAMIDAEPQGTTITLIGAQGLIATFTN